MITKFIIVKEITKNGFDKIKISYNKKTLGNWEDSDELISHYINKGYFEAWESENVETGEVELVLKREIL